MNIFEIIYKMNQIGIQLRPIWKPLILNKAFKQFETSSQLKISNDLFKRTICLPSSTSISSKDIKIVCEKLLRYSIN